MKKEKLRVEHEKNLLEIQLKQYDEIFQNRQSDSDKIS